MTQSFFGQHEFALTQILHDSLGSGININKIYHEN